MHPVGLLTAFGLPVLSSDRTPHPRLIFSFRNINSLFPGTGRRPYSETSPRHSCRRPPRALCGFLCQSLPCLFSYDHIPVEVCRSGQQGLDACPLNHGLWACWIPSASPSRIVQDIYARCLCLPPKATFRTMLNMNDKDVATRQ